jgi:hypothetical protein
MAGRMREDVSSGGGAATLRRSLWYVEQGRVDLLAEPLAAPREGEALVRTLWSGISRGTERLVLGGRVPPGEHARMRAPRQAGDFPFPVKYGYAAVGRVEHGPPHLIGRTVFCLNPHEDAFVAEAAALAPVPDTVPARRAVLAANMETALNAVWDGALSPGDRTVVVGGGVVGCLIAALASRIPGTRTTLVDPLASRRAIAAALGVEFAASVAGDEDADVVFHASGGAAGLAAAIAASGLEARVVEASWHGTGATAVELGGAFHSRRLRLVSSQVGHVPAERRARWTPRRRLDAALALLDDPRLDALLDTEVAFADLPRRLPALLAPDADVLGIAVGYST